MSWSLVVLVTTIFVTAHSSEAEAERERDVLAGRATSGRGQRGWSSSSISGPTT